MSPTLVSVNLVGIILLSIHVKKTAFGWNETKRNNSLTVRLTEMPFKIKQSMTRTLSQSSMKDTKFNSHKNEG